jgi:Arc/MetJ-type ribon-helix-helix transcriptional regulator
MCLIASHRLRRVGPGPVILPAPEPPRACLQAHAAGQARTRDDGNHAAYRWSAEPGKGTGQGAERLPAGRAFRSYDPGVSDRKIRVTVRLEPHLAAYAERLVEAGKAPSVSAVVNDALEARRQRDLKARRLWQEAAERADPDKVARMIAHVEAQAAQLPASHRYR